MLFIDNKYTKWYYNIINNAKGRSLPKEIKTENHHIIPECFYINRKRKGPKGWLDGNPEDPENKVRVNKREHFICHWLLTKMTEGKAKILTSFALNGMRRDGNNTRYQTRITSRVFEKIKSECAELSRQMNTGRKMSAESSVAKSRATKGHHKSEEWKNNIAKANKGKNKGKIPWNKGMSAPKGEQSPRYNHTIYSFKNLISGEVVSATSNTFYKTFNLDQSSVSKLISGAYKQNKNWIILK